MGTVYVFLANGFEEIEGLTQVDLLRRAGLPVKTVGVGAAIIKGAHDIPVTADVTGQGFTLPDDADMVVFPGGSVGTDNLLASAMVAEVLAEAARRDIYITAICAAPTVLHQAGLLAGKRVTAFPSYQSKLTGCTVTGGPVEVDGKIITARSAGVALAFGHALITALAGKAKADAEIASLYPQDGPVLG
ncbi:MAG: DJ-1/PfpI family protein [Ruminococcaceae bacterium]|nr:DJ-1/PfpI family protein [Oscillospiraceae bacterium]